MDLKNPPPRFFKNNFSLHRFSLLNHLVNGIITDDMVKDLKRCGMLDDTLVVWMGEVGRTPTINTKGGRDHWPQCYSAVVAGGGIRGGQVVGRSDRTGSYPESRAVSPADIHATVFSALGYDPHAITYLSSEGRPFTLSEGEPIDELL